MGKVKQARPLADFMKAKRRAACKVCALPSEVLDQLIAARSAKIRRADMLEWLRTEVGAEITDAEMTAHYSARHANE